MIKFIAAMAFAMLLAACGQDNSPTQTAENANSPQATEPAAAVEPEVASVEKHPGLGLIKRSNAIQIFPAATAEEPF